SRASLAASPAAGTAPTVETASTIAVTTTRVTLTAVLGVLIMCQSSFPSVRGLIPSLLALRDIFERWRCLPFEDSRAACRESVHAPGDGLQSTGPTGDPMIPLDLDKLTPEQRSMVALWEAHLKAEWQDKDAHASCDTMVANPCVSHVAVLTGGVGRRQLENYY